MSKRTSLVLALALGAAFTGSAAADTKDFQPAYWQGKQVDWCLYYGKSCGKPAADAFCEKVGFDSAKSFTRDNSPALPTLVLGSGQLCKQEGSCAGFLAIRCVSSPGNLENDVQLNPIGGDSSGAGDQPLNPGDKVVGQMVYHTYSKPKIKGVRLDWCKHWSAGCGQPAADAFCQARGFAASNQFSQDPTPVTTRVITTGEICDNHTCRGFNTIRCERALHG